MQLQSCKKQIANISPPHCFSPNTRQPRTNTSYILCNQHLLIIVDIFENILITCEKTDSVFQEHIFQGLA